MPSLGADGCKDIKGFPDHLSGHDWSERFWSPTSSQGIYEPKTVFIFGHDQDGAHIVSRKVRQWDHAPYVYLILLTSKDQQEDIIAGLEAEADDYLIKPFDPQELEARLRAGQRILDLQAALLTSLEQLAQAHQREVEIGAKFQQTLLLGQPPGDLTGAQIAALTIPSQPVDGDFYDFFQYYGDNNKTSTIRARGLQY